MAIGPTCWMCFLLVLLFSLIITIEKKKCMNLSSYNDQKRPASPFIIERESPPPWEFISVGMYLAPSTFGRIWRPRRNETSWPHDLASFLLVVNCSLALSLENGVVLTSIQCLYWPVVHIELFFVKKNERTKKNEWQCVGRFLKVSVDRSPASVAKPPQALGIRSVNYMGTAPRFRVEGKKKLRLASSSPVIGFGSVWKWLLFSIDFQLVPLDVTLFLTSVRLRGLRGLRGGWGSELSRCCAHIV